VKCVIYQLTQDILMPIAARLVLHFFDAQSLNKNRINVEAMGNVLLKEVNFVVERFSNKFGFSRLALPSL
jgi:hypothetical protein